MALFGKKKEEAPSTRGHILVVDDDPETRVLARAILEKAHFKVSEAIDGGIALERLIEGNDYDLMLLDLEMPRVHGRQVLEEVRSSDDNSELPIVILTGRTEKQVEELFMELGADGYIRKPIQPVEFVRICLHAIRQARARGPG